ncbi:MAG: SPOR domain-containing protein [Rubrivivax sp.]
MDLLSFFRRRAPAAANAPARGAARPAGAAGAEAPVAEARARARRRLIGAVVLLGIGVVAFPLLFETEPRPIPVDLPIELPRKDGLPPLVVPPSGGGASRSGRIERAEAPTTTAEPAAAATATPQPADALPTPAELAPRETEAPPREAPREPVPTAAERAVPPPPPAPAPAPAPARPTATPSAAPAAPATDGARAKALLEGKTAAPAGATRFVVQVGAFADASAVRDVRAKVERLGLKTYTQVVHLAAGDRTRVRIGPFEQREQADAALVQLKKAGLAATVMTQ